MKKKWQWLLVGFVLFLVVIGFILKIVFVQIERSEREAKFPNRGIPVININLNGVGIEEIDAGSKEIKYKGNELDIYNDGRMREFEDVEIKGRGNGTWIQEKKPYQIKFKKGVELFGMGKARKWYLLANAMDISNLRTVAAFKIEEMLDMKYRFEGKFIELYIDEEYRGLYYLTRAVEIAKDVVDLKDSMGVLVELDNLYGRIEKHYETRNGDVLVIKDAVREDMVDKAMMDFLQRYNEFEVAVAEKNFAKIAELVDVKSFAQYYLLSEFTVNPDAYWTSFYMYKDGMNDKIHAGPGWDFDLGLANEKWVSWIGEDAYSPRITMVRKRDLMTKEEYEAMNLVEGDVNWYESNLRLSHIMFDLMDIPEFREEVKRIFQEKMSGRVTELVNKITQDADVIRENVLADEERWGEEGFDEEVDKMRDWIIQRYDYFEQVYGKEEDNVVVMQDWSRGFTFLRKCL